MTGTAAARAGKAAARSGIAAGRPGIARTPGEPFLVELERFQGPLDLLLHLIRSQDIDVFDIPIARITRQFQDALAGGLDRMPLERAGEFLEMAATLVRIKAQLLLPRSGEPDWDEDPRAELVHRLLEYEFFRDVSHVLETAEAQRRRHAGKGYIVPRAAPDRMPVELELSLEDFLRAAAGMPEPIPPATHRAPVRTVTVAEKISLLRRLIGEVRKRLPFDRLFAPWGTRAHAVASLLACLELARQQLLRIEQAHPFASIWILPARKRGGRSRAGEAAVTPAGEAALDRGSDAAAEEHASDREAHTIGAGVEDAAGEAGR